MWKDRTELTRVLILGLAITVLSLLIYCLKAGKPKYLGGAVETEAVPEASSNHPRLFFPGVLLINFQVGYTLY